MVISSDITLRTGVIVPDITAHCLHFTAYWNYDLSHSRLWNYYVILNCSVITLHTILHIVVILPDITLHIISGRTNSSSTRMKSSPGIPVTNTIIIIIIIII